MKWIIDSSEELPLAVIENDENGNGICTLDPEKLPHEQNAETLANARLIAAAPDMLEAFQKMKGLIPPARLATPAMHPLVQIVDAILAKLEA